MRFVREIMMKKYNKKSKYLRLSVNCGSVGDPVRDIVEKKIKEGHNQSQLVRDAILTMWSNDEGYKQRKINFMKKQLIQLHNDISFMVKKRKQIQEELLELGLTDDEIAEVTYG